MATDLLPADLQSDDEVPHRAGSPLVEDLRSIVKPLASLKLTVTLFALAIFLIFTGTLAQTRHDISWVLHNYFRAMLVWIDFKTFFPPAWFNDHPRLMNMPGSFPFPGGFTIGALMAANLLAAHGLRFKMQSTGRRLWTGLSVIVAGCLLTWLVIVAGPDKDGSQASAPIDWLTLWKVFLIGLGCACVGIAWMLMRLDSQRKLERVVLAGVGTLLLTLLAFLLFHVDPQFLNPSAMRILWQLLKAEAAAAVLLAGCILVFRKRAGIVLLHAGVGLIMANELVVHFLHKEQQMQIAEGQTTNYAYDLRTVELTVTDKTSNPKSDIVTVIPERLLRDSLDNQTLISDPRLPVDFRITKFYENSAGAEDRRIVEARPITGSDTGGRVNMPSIQAEVFEKRTGKPLDTRLFSTLSLYGERIKVGDQKYEIALRFEGEHKPYSMTLHEVRGDMYLGTSTPRNYSSDLQLADEARGVDRRVLIKMNEPLRYAGETFYQSEYDDGTVRGDGIKKTTLQVVTNFGWMIPYVACMIVVTGLLSQFIITLTRFLRRRDAVLSPTESGQRGVAMTFLPAVVAACAVAFLIYAAILPTAAQGDFDLYAFGELPVASGGRVQPMDSLARNALRLLSLREAYLDASGLELKSQNGSLLVVDVVDGSPAARAGLKPKDRITEINSRRVDEIGTSQAIELLEGAHKAEFGAKADLSVVGADGSPRRAELRRQHQPAIRWLIELIARPEVADRLRVFRIDNPDVLHTLGLERREYFRFSFEEINAHPELLEKARIELDPDHRAAQDYGPYEKKLEQLFSRLTLYQVLRATFLNQPIPSVPTAAEKAADPEAAGEAERRLIALAEMLRAVMRSHVPLAVPTIDSRDPKIDHSQPDPNAWRPYLLARFEEYLGKPPVNPATTALESIFDAYAAQDAAAFNQAVAGYAASLATQPPEQTSTWKVAFESWFNYWSPFSNCQWLYFAAFCLAALAWLGWRRPLNRAAFWLIFVAFLAHSIGDVSRVLISGRPPVINLYSTAIFIGWGAVCAGFVLEAIYHMGYGNIVASVAGFATLLIADKLTLLLEPTSGGDTIGVMQAVLDTQFWLATHVTTENLGYCATYVAGLLGLIYVVRGLLTPSLAATEGKDLARMIYGTLCFAIFFTFFGTVLGGLWADDSWGRFWGWDPKENGALMIVLWNALVLHARWDGLVKDRGLAVLAIGGNIVTSWSYFGVNQLGVGLHSYGFTEGVLPALSLFTVSQLVAIGAGLLPLRFWRSRAAAATS